MNVLHVIPAVAPCYGGPSRAVLDMCRSLSAEGIGVQIATTDASGRGRLPMPHCSPLPFEGVQTRFFPRQASESFKISLPLARWLRHHVSEFDAVHIHAIFSHSSLSAAGACRRWRVPYVVRPLGSLDPWSLSQKPLRKRLLWHFGVRQMLGGAGAIHYTTQAERRLAEQVLGPTSGTVIPLGVEPRVLAGTPAAVADFRAKHSSLGDRPYVLILSRLHPKKQIEFFLDVFVDVTCHDRMRDWRLVLAGDGDPSYARALRRRALEHGEDRVICTGWLDGPEKQAVLAGAALLALPSRQENFGLAALEALACGVPVLVSAHVNLADEIEHANAGWVVPLQRDAMTTALQLALGDDAQRAARGAAARSVAARYGWPQIVKQLISLYESLPVGEVDVESRARGLGDRKRLAPL